MAFTGVWLIYLGGKRSKKVVSNSTFSSFIISDKAWNTLYNYISIIFENIKETSSHICVLIYFPKPKKCSYKLKVPGPVDVEL